MNLAHFVQVIACTDGGGGIVATGYPVAPGRVLTASHVLHAEDATGDVRVRWFGLEGATGTLRPATIAWDGHEQGLDAALLACEFPPKIAAPALLIGRAEPRINDEWTSAGFAAAGMRDRRDRLTSLSGKIGVASQGQPLELSVGSPPKEAEGWQGASGAPVFVGHRILGVVTLVPGSFAGGRLWATPTCRLLEDEKFRAEVGYAQKWQHLEHYNRDMVAALARFEEATKCLARELRMDERSLPHGSESLARAVVEQLLERRLDDVLPLLHAAHRALRTQVAAADAVWDVAKLVMPAVGRVAEVETADWLSSTHGLIRLPAVTETLAEIILAAADGRAALFQPGTNPPTPLLQVPRAPQGGEPAGAEKFEEYWDDWAIGRFVPEAHRKLAQAHVTRVQIAAQRLQEAVELDKQRFYYVVEVFKQDEVAVWNEVIERVRRNYPAVAFVLLTRDDTLLKREATIASFINRMLDPGAGRTP